MSVSGNPNARLAGASALVAIAAVAGALLLQAAVAGDDVGLRRDTLWPEPVPVRVIATAPATPRIGRRNLRRIWAASAGRPLRISLARMQTRGSVTANRQPRRARVAAVTLPRVIGRRDRGALLSLPRPNRSPIVSLYQDGTLRNGDAVMMADGIHVFRGFRPLALRAARLRRLASAPSLDGSLRQTLNDLDRNPPVRWSSLSSAG